MRRYFVQLPEKLNEIDNKGDLPLDLALQNKCEGIAKTLVKHHVDINKCDAHGVCLLHKAVQRGTFHFHIIKDPMVQVV